MFGGLLTLPLLYPIVGRSGLALIRKQGGKAENRHFGTFLYTALIRYNGPDRKWHGSGAVPLRYTTVDRPRTENWGPRTVQKKKAALSGAAFVESIPGSDLLSHTVARAVPSGLRSLTTVFGMGTGGSSSLRSPRN